MSCFGRMNVLIDAMGVAVATLDDGCLAARLGVTYNTPPVHSLALLLVCLLGVLKAVAILQ